MDSRNYHQTTPQDEPDELVRRTMDKMRQEHALPDVLTTRINPITNQKARSLLLSEVDENGLQKFIDNPDNDFQHGVYYNQLRGGVLYFQFNCTEKISIVKAAATVIWRILQRNIPGYKIFELRSAINTYCNFAHIRLEDRELLLSLIDIYYSEQ